jgi:O-antigen ligase
LILSATRTAWVGFIGTLFLILLLHGRAKNKIAMALCLLAIVSLFWFPIVERVQDLIKTMGVQSGTLYSSSLEGRIFLYWPQGVEAWLQRPILGHGLGSTSYLTYRPSNIINKPPHSEYIQLLQELGIVGLILYLFLLWRLLSPILKMSKLLSTAKVDDRAIRTHVASLMVYIGFVIMSFGQDTFHNGAIGTLFIIFMAIVQATYFLFKENLQMKWRQVKY